MKTQMASKQCPHCQSSVPLKATRCPHCQGDMRNWFVRHKIITGLLGLIVLGIIGSAMGGSNGDSKKTVTREGDDTINMTGAPVSDFNAEPEKPVQAKSYQQVFTFNGNGAKKSEPFTITGDRFKVKYDCKGDLCQAFLYETSSNAPKEVLMNSTGSITDETIVYGAGEYYIQANTIGTYSMTVEDYR